MAQGYPSKRRARRAFERGVATGFRRRDARCPYRNRTLAELWERGRQMGLAGRRPRDGVKAGPDGGQLPPRHPHRPQRRPFAPPPSLGGRHYSHGAFRRDWGGHR